MKQWLALGLALGLATVAPVAPVAAQTAAQAAEQALPPAAQARSDSLTHAALVVTVARKRLFVDVRAPEEFQAGHLPGAINLPLADLERRWPELKAYPRRQIVLYCRSGHRAGVALETVKQHGIANAVNGGGLESLRRELQSKR